MGSLPSQNTVPMCHMHTCHMHHTQACKMTALHSSRILQHISICADGFRPNYRREGGGTHATIPWPQLKSPLGGK